MLDTVAFKFIILVFNSILQFLPKWDKLVRFFMFRCRRCPLWIFGPIGILLGMPGVVLLIVLLKINAIVEVSVILIAGVILSFCFGLLSELISFANTKQVKDYTVETFLNAKKQ